MKNIIIINILLVLNGALEVVYGQASFYIDNKEFNIKSTTRGNIYRYCKDKDSLIIDFIDSSYVDYRADDERIYKRFYYDKKRKESSTDSVSQIFYEDSEETKHEFITRKLSDSLKIEIHKIIKNDTVIEEVKLYESKIRKYDLINIFTYTTYRLNKNGNKEQLKVEETHTDSLGLFKTLYIDINRDTSIGYTRNWENNEQLKRNRNRMYIPNLKLNNYNSYVFIDLGTEIINTKNLNEPIMNWISKKSVKIISGRYYIHEGRNTTFYDFSKKKFAKTNFTQTYITDKIVYKVSIKRTPKNKSDKNKNLCNLVSIEIKEIRDPILARQIKDDLKFWSHFR